MGRHVHLHMDLLDHEAATIREAAKLNRVRPSYYVLDRVLQVAEREIEELRKRSPSKATPEDIDAGTQQVVSGDTGDGGSGGGGDSGVTASKNEEEDTEEDRLARLARYRKKKGPDFRVSPLV